MPRSLRLRLALLLAAALALAASSPGSLLACAAADGPADGPACADGTCAAAAERDFSPTEGEWYGEFFPEVPKIRYEGPNSTSPLAFRYYNADEVVLGKRMKDWLRFSVAFWHSFRGDGGDPFGSATKTWPWARGLTASSSNEEQLQAAFKAVHALFELMGKLGVERWCFHDRDIAPEGRDLAEANRNLDLVAEVALELQKGTDIRPLWGTAQLFKHRRYMHGAMTSPNATVFAYAAAQVKKAMDVTHLLGGENYLFWGGREGYQSLLNTDMGLELDNMARFLKMAVAYKKRIGFKGGMFLEPKPQEPMKHQYDYDAATTANFLRKHGLAGEFKLNIECNHATLSGHSCEHELETARLEGLLGNLDANTGDPQVGWDTDQFLVDPREATLVALAIVRNGGLGTGGINFDAKLRRESTTTLDLVYAHVAGMDALARGLRNVARLKQAGLLDALVADRYASWHAKAGTTKAGTKGDAASLGARILAGKVGFEELSAYALSHADPGDLMASGRQELAELYLDMAMR